MKVRKIVAGLAAVSMLAAFSAQVVAAAETVTIKADTVEAKAGEQITLNIDFADVPAAGISMVDFAVKYDASVLTDVKVTAGPIVSAGVDAAEGFADLTAFYTNVDATNGLAYVNYSTGIADAQYYVTQNGTFAVVTATVAAGTAAGTYDVEIVANGRPTYQGSTTSNTEINLGVYDSTMTNLTTYNAKAVAGAVVVVDPTQSTESTQPTTETTTVTTTTTETQPTTGTTATTESTQPTSGGTKDAIYGDVEDDGDVDLLDVILLNKNLLGIAQIPTAQGKVNADVNIDGAVDGSDSLYILQSTVSLVTLPIQK